MFLHIVSHEREKKTFFGRISGMDRDRRGKVVLLSTVLGSLLLTAVVYALYSVCCHSTFFQITTIHVNNNSHLSRDGVLELTGIDMHSNLFSIDPEKITAAITAHEWVERVAVEKRWPNKLALTITERIPVAIVNTGEAMFYVDRTGEMFVRVPIGGELDYPVISGLSRAGDTDAQTMALADAVDFLRFAQDGSVSLPKQNISELVVEEQGKLTVFLADRPFPIYLGRGKMGQKYNRLASVLHWLYKNREFEVTEFIQFDYQPDKVLVRKT